MVVLTAANTDIAQDDAGRVYKHFSYRGVINETIKKAEECGYKSVVYDLGTLGIGKRFYVKDKSFATKGYYENEVHKGYKSKSLFKPKIVKDCIEQHNDFTVYLDGDAQLCDNIDEILGNDYDIGVTLRSTLELESEWHKEHFEIVKYVNAGVIFFNTTPSAKKFIDIWDKRTEQVGNDQMALNQLTCPDYLPEALTVLNIDGIRIKYFSGSLYNHYYFNEGFIRNIKIMHFKGPVRNFYPFDWKKRIYIMTVIPVKNNINPFIKKLLFR